MSSQTLCRKNTGAIARSLQILHLNPFHENGFHGLMRQPDRKPQVGPSPPKLRDLCTVLRFAFAVPKHAVTCSDAWYAVIPGTIR